MIWNTFGKFQSNTSIGYLDIMHLHVNFNLGCDVDADADTDADARVSTIAPEEKKSPFYWLHACAFTIQKVKPGTTSIS